MTEHDLFYYPYASFTNVQRPLLRVAALYFDKRYILRPVGASWATVGADHHARDAVKQLQDAGILQTVTPADVLAKYAGSISDAIHRDMHDRKLLALCEAQDCRGDLRHETAARPARRQENRKGEWSALPLEFMSISRTDHSPRGG